MKLPPNFGQCSLEETLAFAKALLWHLQCEAAGYFLVIVFLAALRVNFGADPLIRYGSVGFIFATYHCLGSCARNLISLTLSIRKYEKWEREIEKQKAQ